MPDDASEAFWILALVGTAVFAFQFVMLLVGSFGGDGKVDGGSDADFDEADGAFDTDAPAGSDLAFTMFSIKGISLLLMGAG